MLLIPCPWCGPRSQIEFTYGGDATVKRPATVNERRRSRVVRVRVSARQPVRPARRTVAAQRRLPALVQGPPRHAHARHPRQRPRRPDAAGGLGVTQSHRLADGGSVDRARTLRFAFDGVRYEGYAGDTLASALLANGVHLVARSFKYHRPRGIVSAGAEEPNALVQLARGARTEPNARATQSSSTTDSSPRARTAGRRCASMSARSTTHCRGCSRPASTTRRSCGRRRRSGGSNTSA